MFGKKKKGESEVPQTLDGQAPEKGGKPKVSKGFGNTIILFIVFFIVFTVIVTGVAFFADKIDFSGSKKKQTLEDLVPKDKMTDPKKGENKEYVMNDKGGIVEKDMPAKPAADDKKAETKAEQPIPDANVKAKAPAPAPLPPVKIAPQIKKPAPKPAPKPVAKKVQRKPDPLSSLAGKATTGKFVVQLASFRHKGDAEKEAKRLRKLIPEIFVVRADLGAKGVWYRIRCFRGISHEEALKKAAAIAKETRYKPYPMLNK